MDKTTSWKNVNTLGYIIQIIALKQLYDIIELHSLELPGLLFSIQMMLDCTPRLVPPSSTEENEPDRNRRLEGHKNSPDLLLNELVLLLNKKPFKIFFICSF